MQRDIESGETVRNEEPTNGIRVLKTMTKEDVLAGLTVGVMAIPQSMAYAYLAGLDPIYGLYTAVIPPLTYALLGNSRQLHVGPVSMVSLITATCISKIDGADTVVNKAAIATLLAVLAGTFQILMGVFRLGTLVNFATAPIISGFTAGASVVVIVSQIQHIFGISVSSGITTIHTLFNTFVGISEGISGYSLALGIVFLASLWAAKALAQRHPNITALKAVGPLFVVVLGTCVTYAFSLDDKGVFIIGDVPSGLPGITKWVNVFEVVGGVDGFSKVLASAMAISFISFMESIAVAKTLANHHGYEVEANRELISLGTANCMGSMFNSYAGAGAFSRSAVASGAGARTQAAAIVAAVVVALTLLFLTPLFFYLPKGVLSAIIIHAVWGLIKISDLLNLRKVSIRDTILWLIAFTGTLYSVTAGLLTAVGISCFLIIKDTSNPKVEIVGRFHDTFVPVSQREEVDPDWNQDIIIIGVYSGTLHGGGAAALKSSIMSLLCGSMKHVLIIDLTSVTSIDTTSLTALKDVMKAFNELPHSTACCFTGVCEPVRRTFEGDFSIEKASSPDSVRSFQIFATLSDAIRKYSDLHSDHDGPPIRAASGY
eukprot:TRINITY_DN1648_c3_g1_i2.p1 TRINITY_DN1648_c3_g1~~TRINITY_DN1648_c3_g1_i2.p1  ORF type:complete len:601 (+),score=126.03 TRINITY_DN1648_c3_g1_i2:43-1845(+)